MQPTLFIRLLTTAESQGDAFSLSCEWLFKAGQGGGQSQGVADYAGLQELVRGQGDLPNLSDQPVQVVALVPVNHVLCVQCVVPGGRSAQVRQALPYVVEEFLAEDVENMHIATGTIKSGSPVRCCLVAKSMLDNWLAGLNALGLRPGHLVAESELLPSAPQSASVLFDGHSAIVHADHQAALVDRANLGLALGVLEVNAIEFVNGEPTAAECAGIDPNVTIETANETGQGTIFYLADRWPEGEAINLLQGAYKPTPVKIPGAVQWRGTAALAALWLVLGFTGLAAKGWWSSNQAGAFEAKSLALYQSIFQADHTATVQNLRRRLGSRLGVDETSARTSLVDFIGHLAAVVEPSMSVKGVDYNRARGEFIVQLVVERYADVDRVREALAGRALQAEITSAEQAEEGVSARFRLGGV